MKEEIRNKILAIRSNLSEQERKWKSQEICQHLRLCDAFINARRVMFYMPIQNEADVTALMEDFPGEKLLPFIQDGRMHGGIIKDLKDTETGMYGTQEPKEKVVEEYIDVIIVPGVAFDRNRNRIGYGKGYYDRFLAYSGAVKIGVAFQEQIVPQIPSEEHDVPMDLIITAEGVI